MRRNSSAKWNSEKIQGMEIWLILTFKLLIEKLDLTDKIKKIREIF